MGPVEEWWMEVVQDGFSYWCQWHWTFGSSCKR